MTQTRLGWLLAASCVIPIAWLAMHQPRPRLAEPFAEAQRREALQIRSPAGGINTGPAQSQAYAIPAGDMERAIWAFARQSGRQVAFSGPAVSGRRTAGYQGAGTEADVLASVLAGSGLSPRLIEGHTFVISGAGPG